MADYHPWQYPLAAAQLAVREGIPADVAHQVITALGADISQAAFTQLYHQASLAGDMIGAESEAPLDAIPGQEFIQQRTTVTSTGFLQQVVVTATDNATGATIEIPYSVRSNQLLSRGEVIEAAIVSQNLRAPDYKFSVQGAMYTGTYELQPMVDV
jgi:hypothetical protein